MNLSEAKSRHARLVEEIRHHDYAYHVLAKPTISDQEYDRSYHELLDLEKAFPELVTPDSPSQRVGGQPIKEFKPVAHVRPMLSLDNTYSEEELRELAWTTLVHPEDRANMSEHIRQLISGQAPTFVLENRCFTKDGRTICIQESVSATRDSAGRA